MVVSSGSLRFWKDNVGIFVKVESTLGGVSWRGEHGSLMELQSSLDFVPIRFGGWFWCFTVYHGQPCGRNSRPFDWVRLTCDALILVG